jgi:C4-dicarboxylate transporter DctM subunit
LPAARRIGTRRPSAARAEETERGYLCNAGKEATALILLLVLLALSLPVAAALGVLLDQLYSKLPLTLTLTLTLALGEVARSSKDFLLVVIPMFILLGEILLRAGVAKRMYDAMVKWMS